MLVLRCPGAQWPAILMELVMARMLRSCSPAGLVALGLVGGGLAGGGQHT